MEPSNNHDQLKALLAQSFHAEEAEDVPPLPENLRDRIRDQYGKGAAAVPPAVEDRRESIITRISRLFAQPQFSGAVAAVVLIAVAAFLLLPNRTESVPGGIRGTDPVAPATPGATIILYGFDSEKAAAIKAVLDPKVATIKEDISNEPTAEGITIIIDGQASEIQGYPDPDAEARVTALPESDAQIADAIARMLKDLSASPQRGPGGD